MLPEFTPLVIVIVAACVFLYGASKTAMPVLGVLAGPVLAAVLTPTLASAFVVPLLIIGDLFALGYYRQHANWKLILKLIPGVLVGFVLTALMFKFLDGHTIGRIIGVLILLSLCLELWQRRKDAKSEPGMSHLHEFFGNTSTDESSTGSSLLRSPTTCDDPNNHSSYWVPALYQDGVYMAPRVMKVRYNVNSRSRAFPVGFMAISGRTDSTASWACVTPGLPAVWSSSVASVPTCSGEQHLAAQITFGECWDGRSLDSPNHMSHLVFRSGNTCPADHRVRVPQVRLVVDYPREATGGSGVTLASGAPSTLHADIFEAWSPGTLARRIAAAR